MIREELNRVREASFDQARVEQPLANFVAHINMAKRDLGELFQSLPDSKSADVATEMLNQLNAMLKRLDRSQGLTKDPWAHVGRRDG